MRIGPETLQSPDKVLTTRVVPELCLPETAFPSKTRQQSLDGAGSRNSSARLRVPARREGSQKGRHSLLRNESFDIIGESFLPEIVAVSSVGVYYLFGPGDSTDGFILYFQREGEVGIPSDDENRIFNLP
jgi:hypothetical protein